MVLALALSLSFVACSSNNGGGSGAGGNGTGGSGDGGGASGNGEAVRDSLTIAISTEPATLDPAKHTSLVAMCVDGAIFTGLIHHNYVTDALEPAIATEWTVSEDGLTYDFTIREDFVFHNGDPVTMEDVVFSVERNVQSPFQSIFFESIESVEAVDDTHLRIKTNKKDDNLLYYLGDYALICPKTIVEADEDGFARKPIGCGPYKFVSWASGIEIKLEAVADHPLGEAPIANLTWRVIADRSAALIALGTGDINAVMTLSGSDFEQVRSMEGVTLDVCPANVAYQVGANAQSGALSDKRVRQAIAHALDKQSIIDGAEYGEATPATNGFIMQGQLGYDENRVGITRDIDKAKALLAEAGHADGLKLTLKCRSTNALHAQIIQANLKEIGIDVEIILLENAAFFADLENGDTELYFLGFGQYTPDPSSNFRYCFRSDSFMTGNYCRIVNAEIDALIEEGERETDTAKRVEIYQKCVDLIEEEAGVIYLYWGSASFAHDSALKGTAAAPLGVYYPYDFYWEN